MTCFIATVLVVNLLPSIYGANILGFIPTPSFSHQAVYQPLWRELSLRGHRVTLLTCEPMNDATLTNLTEIDLSFLYKLVDGYIPKIIEDNVVGSYILYLRLFIDSVHETFQHPAVKDLLANESNSFDLFIGESHISAHFALAEKFQCPFIAVSSLIGTDAALEIFGVPTHPVVFPSFMSQCEKPETLFQRLFSVYVSLAIKFFEFVYVTPYQDFVIRTHFGNDFPSSAEIMSKASLLLENTSPVFDAPRARTPNAVTVSGIYERPRKPLPEELKNVLDSATEGVIYFSLGSHIKSTHTSETLRQEFLELFTELPYTVIWKYETEDLTSGPKNVFTFKWLPQADLLRHPNVKVFITHCGLQSIEDAINAGVPMVGVPFVADQFNNAQKLVAKEMGLSIHHQTLDKENFKKAIMQVIENPKFRDNVKKIRNLMKDQPMSGLETAIWWTEYVIRHKGAKHLRSPLIDISWYQYYLLDVIGVVLVVFAMFLFVCISLLKFIFCRIKTDGSVEKKKQ